jgi:predicted HicB family RNase H-like nuclease
MDRQSLHVRLPVALHDQLRAAADEQGISLNTLVATLLAGGIGFKLDK